MKMYRVKILRDYWKKALPIIMNYGNGELIGIGDTTRLSYAGIERLRAERIPYQVLDKLIEKPEKREASL